MSITRWSVVLGFVLAMWNAVALGVALVRGGCEQVGGLIVTFLWVVPGDFSTVYDVIVRPHDFAWLFWQ